MSWDDIKHQLDVALNEADLLGVEVDPARRIAAATFRVLTLPVDGPPPQDSRVQILLRPVGRVIASLRSGRWDDASAEVVSFEVTDLLPVVQRFGGRPIYGWEFFDVHDKELSRWGKRLSLDWHSGSDGLSRSITVFQESARHAEQHLDVCIWFDDLEIRRPDGSVLSLDEFAAGGKRWWDAMDAGDQRTQDAGIIPAAPNGGEN